MQTFGVSATFVGSTDTPEDVAYHALKTALTNVDQFGRLQPALAVLDEKENGRGGLSAPLPYGAAKQYNEAGADEDGHGGEVRGEGSSLSVFGPLRAPSTARRETWDQA